MTTFHEDLSLTRVVFFQVADAAAKCKRIADTARAHFGKKESLLFFVDDDIALHFVDELLWKFPETAFLPHAVATEPTGERIAITKLKSNLNGAHYAFNLCPTPLLIPGFKIIYEFEDMTAPNKKSLSVLRFNAYKQAKMPLESRS
jgi:DNA polymerase IIIc chi subunit